MAEGADFLVEIGTEELPPKTLRELSAAFAQALEQGLGEARLAHGGIEAFATPRRLALRVRALAWKQPEQTSEHRGPPVRVAFDEHGGPTRAALAFAASCGVEIDSLERERTDRGEWLLHRVREPGRPAAELLPALVQRALDALPVARRMRWGESEASFVRPVHWAVLLHGREVVEATLFGHESGRVTRGHRFMASGPLELDHAGEYEQRLERDGYVVAGFDDRRRRLLASSEALAAAHGGALVCDDALLDEVTSLVEWPVPLAGQFEEAFLQLPPEVLIATLQSHQRYFPLAAPDGALLPWFIAVANLESRDPAQVRAGNERVVGPRLADAAFFYAQDRQTPLAERVAALERVVFQKDLGSLADKSRRVAALARGIADRWGWDPSLAERAALLSRCDLLTDMVGEFPELQGRMGRYYAEHDGEADEVAAALEEQYRPRFAGDALPAGRTGLVLALAEKLDTLAGIFAIGQRPSGNRDPFALRRAALGVLRILIERELELELPATLAQAVAQQPVRAADGLADEIYDYILERLRGYYGEGTGGARVTPEILEAVLALRPPSPLDCHQRVLALAEFQHHAEAASLIAANKRVANILRKSGAEAAPEVQRSRLELAAECALHEALTAMRGALEPALEARRYREAMAELSRLRAPIDAFFDQVMVMDEDPAKRANRLALLVDLRTLFSRVADLSRLPG